MAPQLTNKEAMGDTRTIRIRGRVVVVEGSGVLRVVTRGGELRALLVEHTILDKTVSKESRRTDERSHYSSLDSCRKVAEILTFHSYFMPRPSPIFIFYTCRFQYKCPKISGISQNASGQCRRVLYGRQVVLIH